MVAAGSDNDENLESGAELHHLEKDETLPGKPSPLGRLKASLPYWRATMHCLGLVCALTLSIIADGYRLDWDPKEGIPPPVTLPNKQTALKEAAFVSKAIAEGVAAGVMRPCRRDALTCILPLQVAFNSAGKPRLVWDGTHVNKHLPDVKFRMETLQREGRDLFERAAWGGTVDISSAYHHIHMHESSIPFLGFEWEGSYYAYTVLPFGLSTAPWIFTLVMSHCVRFLRSTGVELIAYLDDLIFAHATPREALSAAQKMLHILPRFGWLIHPTKCTGVAEALSSFQALGTVVDLASQTYHVPPDTIKRILAKAAAMAEGPSTVCVRAVAALKGLITSTWVATGAATRLRTRAMDDVIHLRPVPRSSRRWALRRSWMARVELSAECRAELRWWMANLQRISGQPIRPRPLDGRFDGDIFSDASDLGVGAYIATSGPDAAASSLVSALRTIVPPGLSARAVERHAQQGIEFMAPLPEELLTASSTLRELYGVLLFIRAARVLLGRGRHRLIMDNLGCVFILGGVVPPFAVGGKRWGEFVSGGSPDPALQRLALELHDMQLAHGFTIVPVWRPREENVRADYLSHVAEMRQHDYRIPADLFRDIDAAWGPYTVDRFATPANVQPLAPPFDGRFCSHFFHPDALWTDALSLPWDAQDVNWAFPPPHLLTRVIGHFRACGARGTLIAPDSPGAPWWPALRAGRGWASFVIDCRPLGPARRVLSGLDRLHADVFGDRGVLALRVDGRRR